MLQVLASSFNACTLLWLECLSQVADKTEEYKDQMNWVTGLVEVELPME